MSWLVGPAGLSIGRSPSQTLAHPVSSGSPRDVPSSCVWSSWMIASTREPRSIVGSATNRSAGVYRSRARSRDGVAQKRGGVVERGHGRVALVLRAQARDVDAGLSEDRERGPRPSASRTRPTDRAPRGSPRRERRGSPRRRVRSGDASRELLRPSARAAVRSLEKLPSRLDQVPGDLPLRLTKNRLEEMVQHVAARCDRDDGDGSPAARGRRRLRARTGPRCGGPADGLSPIGGPAACL